jgi:hypothetical protein
MRGAVDFRRTHFPEKPIGAAAGAFLATARLRGQSADPTTLTIGEAAKQMSSRRLSPIELTRAYLERIEKHNPRIDAYIRVTPDAALAQARPDYPEAVSRTYVGSLLKRHVCPDAGEDWFGNVGLGFGAGLAYGRFAESGRLASGATTTNPIVGGVFGLSFRWPERIDEKAVAGIGLVVTF